LNSCKFGCKGNKYLANSQIFITLFLFYRNQVIVLLTLLCQQILAVDQVLGRDSAVLIGQFLLVQRDAATLYHLAHFAL